MLLATENNCSFNVLRFFILCFCSVHFWFLFFVLFEDLCAVAD